MSDAVDLLEALGREARFHEGSSDGMELALSQSELDSKLQAALLAGDPVALRASMGLAPMIGLIMPAEEDEEGEGEGEKEDVPSPQAPSSIAREPGVERFSDNATA